MARTTKTKAKTTAPIETTKVAASVPPARAGTKASAVITLLRSKRGVTVPDLMEATGWQAHSVRGFLAGSLRKRHGLDVVSEKRDDEPRRYHLR